MSQPSPMAEAATSCHACGKGGGKLLLCGRCRDAWFCNRECQVFARNELGHRGAQCRPAGGAQQSPSSSAAPSRPADGAQQSPSSSAAPSHPSTPIDLAKLGQSYYSILRDKASAACMPNTRIGRLAAVEKIKEAAAVADFISGKEGACCCADADSFRSGCLLELGDKAAAAHAACSSLRAARASDDRTMLVTVLAQCGEVASEAPDEMACAERESREQERLGGSPPSYGGLDLSQEGRISLPTTPAALSRLGLAYNEAAVAICDAARGRDSPAADGNWRVPALFVEARARGGLGGCLFGLGEEPQRSLELLRQAVVLWRQVLRTVVQVCREETEMQLAIQLFVLGAMLKANGSNGSDGIAEAEACLREALALGEGVGSVGLMVKTLRILVNLSGVAHARVGPAEAEAFRSRLNQLLVQMGRSVDTSCSICFEPLAPPADGAAEDAASVGAGYPLDSCVWVLDCDHQFHRGCLITWWSTVSNQACPLCKE